MGIRIVLEDEDGTEIAMVADDHNYLAKVLPERSNKAFRCLAFIDLYGDTTFNRFQIPDFRDELKLVTAHVHEKDSRDFFEKIDQIAEACLSDYHQYLKIYGD